MDTQDEYLVYIDEGRTHRYYKNKILHREAGPAYVCTIDVAKYTNLVDEDLYKKVYEPVVKTVKKEVKTENGDLLNQVFQLYELPIKSTYYGSSYYLEGVRYNKDEFEIMVLKQKLEKELSQENKIEPKRAKL
jgi:hypothetical protein